MEQTFKEFKQQLVNKKDREFKVKNSWGMYDAYKLLRKNHWLDIGKPVSEKNFYAIVRGINKHLAENIAMGKDVKFPEFMGKLELKKQKRGVSIVKGKVKVTYPVNWNETLKLWYEDPEAMRNKVLLRNEEKYVYRVRYDVFDATYENKCFYQFVLNTFIRKALKDNIKSGKVDTAWC